MSTGILIVAACLAALFLALALPGRAGATAWVPFLLGAFVFTVGAVPLLLELREVDAGRMTLAAFHQRAVSPLLILYLVLPPSMMLMVIGCVVSGAQIAARRRGVRNP